MDKENKLRAIIEQQTGHDMSGVAASADLVEAIGLSSIDGLRVIAAIERKMNVTFPDGTLGKLRSVDEILKVIGETAS